MHDLLTSLSIIVASGTAIWGIVQWRRQMIVERKMNLAEDVLSVFYEAKDVFGAARSPASFGSEGQSFFGKKRKEFSQETVRRASAYYAPAERLYREKEFFSKLQSLKYRFSAVFGEQAREPFDTIIRTRAEVISASEMLAQSEIDRVPGNPALDRDTNRQFEREIWSRGEDDDISRDIARAVDAIRDICEPVLTHWLKI